MMSFQVRAKENPRSRGLRRFGNAGLRSLRGVKPRERPSPRGGTQIDAQPEEPRHECSGVDVDHKGCGSQACLRTVSRPMFIVKRDVRGRAMADALADVATPMPCFPARRLREWIEDAQRLMPLRGGHPDGG